MVLLFESIKAKLKTCYSKTCLKWPLKKRTKIGFQDRLSPKEGQKYCRMLSWSILQYFQPSLSYHLSLRPLFCLHLCDCLRHVLLYLQKLILQHFFTACQSTCLGGGGGGGLFLIVPITQTLINCKTLNIRSIKI